LAVTTTRSASFDAADGAQHAEHLAEPVGHEVLADAEPVRDGFARGAHGGVCIVLRTQQRQRVRQERKTLRGQRECACAALYQACAHCRFQVLQMRADGRLRAVHLLRRARDRAGARDGREASQPGGIEVIHSRA